MKRQEGRAGTISKWTFHCEDMDRLRIASNSRLWHQRVEICMISTTTTMMIMIMVVVVCEAYTIAGTTKKTLSIIGQLFFEHLTSYRCVVVKLDASHCEYYKVNMLVNIRMLYGLQLLTNKMSLAPTTKYLRSDMFKMP
jgi:hypothetical protein